ncbi:hypothetical protein EVAR_62587_1 [Eumeta japonica]|uniref:Uncharacterized protein n=1 Tax=Eumeta variegata TaxID=151549 RepID=A0A4C1Y9X3_EUMVA|nr:hypothetical protein EVAR_62587_1 [Eumeta japonica]
MEIRYKSVIGIKVKNSVGTSIESEKETEIDSKLFSQRKKEHIHSMSTRVSRETRSKCFKGAVADPRNGQRFERPPRGRSLNFHQKATPFMRAPMP